MYIWLYRNDKDKKKQKKIEYSVDHLNKTTQTDRFHRRLWQDLHCMVQVTHQHRVEL